MTVFDLTLDRRGSGSGRVAVFEAVRRRRSWPPALKDRVILEALEPGAVVSVVARRHDIRPQQLFGWLRQARLSGAIEPTFVPVTIAEEGEPAAMVAGASPAPPSDGVVEVWFDGVALRAGAGASPDLVAAMIRALRSGR